MPTRPSDYHRGIAEEKRAAIVRAATDLFLKSGYDRTSLAKIADASGVSKATLFKQFPTKATLFEAIVRESWTPGGSEDLPSDVDLVGLGRRYVELLGRPEMVALFRIVIAEVPRFPELGRTQFDLGKMPYFDSVRAWFDTTNESGRFVVEDAELAATQFLGMISNFVFWPKLLLVDWSPSAEQCERAVLEAAATMEARYRAVR